MKGFYEGALDGAEAEDFAAAKRVEGIDEEIALLRVRIKEAWKSEGQDFELMLRSIRVLSHLVGARYRLPSGSLEQLGAAIRTALLSAGLDTSWIDLDGSLPPVE
jgi:hypothetical protein